MKQILTTPDPRLREQSEKVRAITPEVKQVIDEMIELSLDWEKDHPHELSAAMAAPQIGEQIRVIIIRDNLDDKDDQAFTALINPEIVRAEGKLVEDFEGCLSVPHLYGKVKRPTKLRLKAKLVDGTEVRLRATDGLARTLLHEIDHLNGVLFIDHIKGREEAFYRLDDQGELQPLDYAKKIKDNQKLWG